jgi:hypothetical protein
MEKLKFGLALMGQQSRFEFLGKEWSSSCVQSIAVTRCTLFACSHAAYLGFDGYSTQFAIFQQSMTRLSTALLDLEASPQHGEVRQHLSVVFSLLQPREARFVGAQL